MAAQYGGLLLPPTTRLPPHVTASHQYSKGAVPEPWGAATHSAARLHHEQASAHHSHAHALDSAGYSAYPTMAGKYKSVLSLTIFLSRNKFMIYCFIVMFEMYSKHIYFKIRVQNYLMMTILRN